jgi:putative OPT family oligopeptide transporter
MSVEPEFEPYIPADRQLPELTPRALLLGTLLGMIFGASSLYLVLKVGLTVSASIPVAVISMALFRIVSKLGVRDATILEHNIVQTAGSAGESIAFGVGVTMPAILILGYDLELGRVTLVSALGGLLGILMMIPLRRALIVSQHKTLKYPEGTACAAVLTAGASAESRAASRVASATTEDGPSAQTIFLGFGLGLVYKTAMSMMKLWKDTPELLFKRPLAGGSISGEISPELLGVGYIIGLRTSAVMAAGGVMAYLVLVPMIKFFGSALPGALPPGHVPIAEMGPSAIRGAYILYIGAGAVAAGGIISLVRSLPTIWRGLQGGLADLRGASSTETAARTDQDVSMRVVLGGATALILLMTLAPALHMNLLGSALVVVLGFLFVTVSSRLTGEIGSSSNPISGMTVATLLITCLAFVLVGWTGSAYFVTALSIGGVVCIAASNGGTTSQDLKTGYLVGATPRLQQVSILVGALASALILGPILLRLNDAATVYAPAAEVAPGLTAPAGFPKQVREALTGPQSSSDATTYWTWHNSDVSRGPEGKYLVDDAGKAVWLVDPGINGTIDKRPDGTMVKKFDAPKATLMSYIIKGILQGGLPWELVLFGVMIAVVLELSGIPSLAFAVGLYLPISSSTPIFVGGLIRYAVDRYRAARHQGPPRTDEEEAAEGDKSAGTFLASGYIAGGAIAGILIAFAAGVVSKVDAFFLAWSEAHNPMFTGPMSDGLSLIPFAALAVVLLGVGLAQRPSARAA